MAGLRNHSEVWKKSICKSKTSKNVFKIFVITKIGEKNYITHSSPPSKRLVCIGGDFNFCLLLHKFCVIILIKFGI